MGGRQGSPVYVKQSFGNIPKLIWEKIQQKHKLIQGITNRTDWDRGLKKLLTTTEFSNLLRMKNYIKSKHKKTNFDTNDTYLQWFYKTRVKNKAEQEKAEERPKTFYFSSKVK